MADEPEIILVGGRDIGMALRDFTDTVPYAQTR